MSEQESTNNTASRRVLITKLVKLVLFLAPALPLLAVFFMFTLPTHFSERMRPDEHAFPASQISSTMTEQRFGVGGRTATATAANGNRKKRQEFRRLSECFDMAYDLHDAPQFHSVDPDPVVVLFTSNRTIDRILARDLMDLISSAPTMPAPMVVLVAANSKKCSRSSASFQAHLDALPFGGGNIRLVVMVDTKTRERAAAMMTNQNKMSLSSSSSTSLASSSPLCFDARSGEALLPNLDAIVVVAGGVPPCFPVRVEESLLESPAFARAKAILSVVTAAGFSRKTENSVFFTRFEQFILGHRTFLNDLFSAVAKLRSGEDNNSNSGDGEEEEEEEEQTLLSLSQHQRWLRMRGIPNMVFYGRDNDDAGGGAHAATSPLRQFVRSILFPGVYSFTFIHERLHHAQIGYLLVADGNKFVSVNHLQLIVFVVVTCSGIQILHTGAVLQQSLVESKSDGGGGGGASLPRSIMFCVCAFALCCFDSLLMTMTMTVTAAALPWFMMLPLSVGMRHIVVGLAVNAVVVNFCSRTTRRMWNFVATIMCGAGMAVVLTLNFALALCLCVPLAFLQSFSYSGSETIRLVFPAAAESPVAAGKTTTAIGTLQKTCRWLCLMAAAVALWMFLSPLWERELSSYETTCYLIAPLLTFACSKLF